MSYPWPLPSYSRVQICQAIDDFIEGYNPGAGPLDVGRLGWGGLVERRPYRNAVA